MPVEAKWIGVTAVAPVVWGANYVVTKQLLPVDAPLWGSALRALPAALVLLAVARALPRGVWWWRSVVLGTLNVGAFFLLVYVAAQLLPSSVAASVMAMAPLAMAGFAWLLVDERPSTRVLGGAVAGILGVLLLVGGAGGRIEPAGVAASAAALLMSSAGAVLAKRWSDGTPLVALTAWQLLFGGLVLATAAVAVERTPPALDAGTAAGFAFTSLVATAIAYLCWFAGLARLRAATVGVIGLLNPVTGVLLGALVAHERFMLEQVGGIALVLVGVLATTHSRTRRIPVQPEPELLPFPSHADPALAAARC
ncbi:DMT family transporter [Nocardioides halotolerans]|uniref:DMT family transporter n=1 Tax=Nocardioides halotolerans TaxID=433660 RepID=UPI001FE133C0|nr:EamA family transporter [Nocardioides halotolerans]